MNNTNIRKQCADILRYLRKHNKWRETRPDTEEDISSLSVDYHTLKDFVYEAILKGVSLDEVYLQCSKARSSEEPDYDDYTSHVTLYWHRKMDDQQYHNYLCEAILPTEYEMNEYKRYLMLKKKYEGEQ